MAGALSGDPRCPALGGPWLSRGAGSTSRPAPYLDPFVGSILGLAFGGAALAGSAAIQTGISIGDTVQLGVELGGVRRGYNRVIHLGTASAVAAVMF